MQETTDDRDASFAGFDFLFGEFAEEDPGGHFEDCERGDEVAVLRDCCMEDTEITGKKEGSGFRVNVGKGIFGRFFSPIPS